MSDINKLLFKNQQQETENYLKYMMYALDVFRYENLPEGLESRHIEKMLYHHGQCFFYEHKAMGLVCLPVVDSNKMNLYGEYDYGMVTSPNGLINEEVKYSDGVHIFNNDLRLPTEIFIRRYADKMTMVESAIYQNTSQQRFPYFITCDKKTELSMKNLYNKIANGEPAIFHSKDLKPMEDIQINQTIAPYVVDKLQLYRQQLESEVLTFLGINNSNFEKRERLLTDEINSNNEFIQRNVQIQYKNRQKACDEINKKFNLNIQVVMVSDLVYEHNIEYNEEEEILKTE